MHILHAEYMGSIVGCEGGAASEAPSETAKCGRPESRFAESPALL